MEKMPYQTEWTSTFSQRTIDPVISDDHDRLAARVCRC